MIVEIRPFTLSLVISCVCDCKGSSVTRMKWVRRAGFFLIALGLVPWGLWTLFDSTRIWSLANDVPITLSKGSHYTTGMVKTNMSALYSIYIDADVPKGIDDFQPTEKELACQVGVNDPEKEPCPNPPVWKFHWTLTSDRGTLQGDSDERIGQGRINSLTGLSREIGEFRTVAGGHYKFDLDVSFDNRDPRIQNPRLMVAVSDFHGESSMFISGLLRFVCLSIAAVGSLLVLGSFFVEWRERRRARVLPRN
jgi:hypothetical protein